MSEAIDRGRSQATLIARLALAQQQRRLARGHQALRGVRAERRARVRQVERAQLVAVEEAVGACRLALAAPLPLAPRQADGPQELLLPILYFDQLTAPRSPGPRPARWRPLAPRAIMAPAAEASGGVHANRAKNALAGFPSLQSWPDGARAHSPAQRLPAALQVPVPRLLLEDPPRRAGAHLRPGDRRAGRPGRRPTAQGAGETVLLVLAGLVIWTLSEYWLHRKVFHWEPDHPIGAPDALHHPRRPPRPPERQAAAGHAPRREHPAGRCCSSAPSG